jgi:hypothetical protein
MATFVDKAQMARVVEKAVTKKKVPRSRNSDCSCAAEECRAGEPQPKPCCGSSSRSRQDTDLPQSFGYGHGFMDNVSRTRVSRPGAADTAVRASECLSLAQTVLSEVDNFSRV